MGGRLPRGAADQAGHGQRPARDRGELAHELDVQSGRLGAVQVWRGLHRESRGLLAVLRLLLVAERGVALRPAPGCRVVRRAVLLGAGWQLLEELLLLHKLRVKCSVGLEAEMCFVFAPALRACMAVHGLRVVRAWLSRCYDERSSHSLREGCWYRHARPLAHSLH